MASITSAHRLDRGTWKAHLTWHEGMPYAHLQWNRDDLSDSLSLNALMPSELLDLIAVAREALERCNAAPTVPEA